MKAAGKPGAGVDPLKYEPHSRSWRSRAATSQELKTSVSVAATYRFCFSVSRVRLAANSISSAGSSAPTRSRRSRAFRSLQISASRWRYSAL